MQLFSTLLLLSAVSTVSAQEATPASSLEKRYQKVRLPPTTTTSTTTEIPKPWVRTIYESVAEIVTPTVIQGVTFSAKPTSMDFKPWVSLDKKGSPKTINPKPKNGRTQNPSPTYSTYFQTATTLTWNYEQLKAHNMEADQTHEEVQYIDEDKTYVGLDPLIRCTPERYFKKGLARAEDSRPFCTPHENVELVMGQTYFFTWYSRHFDSEVEKVRLHFSYVKESIIEKGMKKREVDSAFFTTEWLENYHGYYAFQIEEEWLLDKFIQSVGVSIQPDNVQDDDFDLLSNLVRFKIMIRPKIAKKNKETRRIEDEGITDDSVYYIILSIPSVVAVFALGGYIFLYITKGERDFTKVTKKAWKSKHKVLSKFKPSSKNKKYSELPQYKKDDKVQ